MKTKNYTLLLASSLACSMAMAYFLNIRMPFYMGDQDPAYLYLSGAVDLAVSHKTLFLDNPGLLPQILCAVLVSLTHMLSEVDISLLEDVLSRPETFLAIHGWTQLCLTSLAVHWLGWTALKLHGSITGAIILQFSTVLISQYMLYRLVGVTATSMLLFFTILLMSLTLIYLDTPKSEKIKLKWPFLFGLMLSMMIMTKFTVLPLGIVPFIILPTWRTRLYYLVTATLVAFLLLVTVAAEPKNFFDFIWRATTRSGLYGAGTMGLDIENSINNALRTLKSDPLYIITLLTLSAALAKVLFSKRFQLQNLKTNLLFISVFAFCVAALGQWLVVVKQFRQYYLLPGSLMLVLGVYLCWHRWRSSCRNKVPIITAFITVILLSMFQLPKLHKWASWRLSYLGSCQDIADYIKTDFPNTPFLSVQSSATMSHALLTYSAFSRYPLEVRLATNKLYPMEGAIFDDNKQLLANKIAKMFPENESIVIVKNNTNPLTLNALELIYKSRYHEVYLFHNTTATDKNKN